MSCITEPYCSFLLKTICLLMKSRSVVLYIFYDFFMFAVVTDFSFIVIVRAYKQCGNSFVAG